jgi:phage gp36-like protein
MLATKDDYLARFGEEETAQLLKSTKPLNIMNPDGEDELELILADAQARVEAVLREVYVYPLQSDGEDMAVPTEVKRITCEVARYLLHDDKVTDHVQNRYDRALEWLDAIRTGTLKLDADLLNEREITYYV